ncbi:hypothetical protein NGK36_17230 [Hafnia alvei]|uniref:hypothetical protein n=1 Tax=Hafnia alvei TaxID=569 RepID=UPI002DB56B77|nr:hypothetical protein [Hafnia alvei]MEB7891015.1 hypothetical protein [Hafnia alvei]
MKKEKKVILKDSDESASIKTVTGWVSSDGRFWGNNESMARWAGATHQKCENSLDHPIYEISSYCELCHKEKQQAKFNTMPRKSWNDEPLVICGTDTYFFDKESLYEYCEEIKVNPSELPLVICEPNYPQEIDGNDYFCDVLPEDGELTSELEAAFIALNEVIKNSAPLSWSEGEVAAIVPDDIK